jgi:hemolysin activation/secretion protein
MASLKMRRAIFFVVFAALLVIAQHKPAYATTTENGPIEDRLPDRAKKDTSPESAAPATTDVGTRVESAPFTLRAVVITGATALDEAEIENVASEFVGKSLTTDDLSRLAGRLTQAYRDRGFFLSRVIIPPQEIKGGKLTAQAIEGYVVAVKADGLSDDDASAQFEALLAERPANVATFERALLLLSDRYSYRVDKPRLVPIEQAPGEFRLELSVTWRPVTLELFADNRGTARNGEDQLYTGVSWNSLLSAGDQLSASLFSSVANVPDTLFAELAYATPWAGGNFWTELGASTSAWQDPLYANPTLGNFDSQKLWLRAFAPIMRTRERSIWLNLQVDARDATRDDGFSPARHEKLRTLRGSFSYAEVSDASQANLNLQVSRGLDALGASQNGDTNLSREDSRPQFTKVRLSASYFTELVDNWSVNLSAMAQYADGSLPSSEQIYFGGARYGRGYDYDVTGGDNGWAASGELRYTFNASILAMERAQLYVFADAGRTRDVYRGTPGYESLFASSAGGGVRLFITQDLVATVEAALPIAYADSLDVNDTTRIFVSLSWWQ